MNTFLYLGVVFMILIILLSIPLKFPAEGWKPIGWTPSAKQTSATIELDRNEMIKKPNFYALWLTYTIGCLAQLPLIN